MANGGGEEFMVVEREWAGRKSSWNVAVNDKNELNVRSRWSCDCSFSHYIATLDSRAIYDHNANSLGYL